MSRIDPMAFSSATLVARRLMSEGAEAVVLTGSHARGDAHPQSDLDIQAVGNGPDYRLERRDTFLVSVSWSCRSEIEAAFVDPARVGAFIPAWRQAVILEESGGIAARIIERATSWTWDEISEEIINRHVAESLTGYAEEAHKLVAMLGRGARQAAAVQRSAIALRIPILMAIHLRLLCDTENTLWDLVGNELGGEWRQVQATALGIGALDFVDTCRAALSLFDLACATIEPLFDPREREVVRVACDSLRTFARSNGNQTMRY